MKPRKNSRNPERREREPENTLLNWRPKTQLGKDVLNGKIKSIQEIIENGMKINMRRL